MPAQSEPMWMHQTSAHQSVVFRPLFSSVLYSLSRCGTGANPDTRGQGSKPKGVRKNVNLPKPFYVSGPQFSNV